jgi:hypothetical protein
MNLMGIDLSGRLVNAWAVPLSNLWMLLSVRNLRNSQEPQKPVEE